MTLYSGDAALHQYQIALGRPFRYAPIEPMNDANGRKEAT